MNIELHNQLETCMNRKASCFLSVDTMQLYYETHIHQVAQDSILLKNTIPYTLIKEFSQGNKYYLSCFQTTFESTSISSNGVDIVFPVSIHSVSQNVREEERYAFTNDENVKLQIRNPWDKETILEKTIIDLSSSGVSFRTKPQRSIFSVGQEFSELRVIAEKMKDKIHSGVVKYNREYIDLKGKIVCQVGIELSPFKE